MTVGDIVSSARFKLGDTDKTGWSDFRLIQLLNEAQSDICLTTGIYRASALLSLTNNNSVYTLPTGCFNVTRLEFNDEQLPMYSREDIDNIRVVTSSKYAIKSNLNRRNIEILPVVTDLKFFSGYVQGDAIEVEMDSFLGVVTGSSDATGEACVLNYEGASVILALNPLSGGFTSYGDISDFVSDELIGLALNEFGVLCGVPNKIFVDAPNMSVYGFLSEVGRAHVQDLFGVTVGVVIPGTYVKVYYAAIPPVVTWLGGSLVLDKLWSQALIHYIVGKARQDDNDEGNYSLGELELAKYEIEKVKAKKISTRSFSTQSSGVRHTIYRRF